MKSILYIALLGLAFLMAGCASYQSKIAKTALEEVVKDSKICTEMTYDDQYLLVSADTTFGKLKINQVGEQRIKIVSREELDKLIIKSNGKYIFLTMRDRKGGREVTVSYTCISFFEENGEPQSAHDHFCRGGMVLIFNKVGKKWRYTVESKI